MPDSATLLGEDVSTASSWRAFENRPLAPFSQERHALDGTGFTPLLGGEPDSDKSIFYVSEDFDLEDFRPRFELKVDIDKISETTGFGPEELVLSLTARDHGTKNYRYIRSWELGEIPEFYECSADETRGLSPLQRLTFCVLVTIRNDIPREFGKPHFKASVLAERAFTVQMEPESPSFPTRPVPPKFFVDRGLPEDSLWFVEFNGDAQATPEEAIIVSINELAVQKLNKAFSGNVAGSLLRNQLAAEIFFDVCQKTLLSSDIEPAEEGSLLEQVRGCFQKFGLNPAQLKEMAEEPGGSGRSRMQCFVQSYLSLTRKIQSADLRRPWQR